MNPTVQKVTLKDITEYIGVCHETTDEPWVHSVLNAKTVKLMLCNGNYAAQRKAYGLYLGATMIGYAVIHTPSKTLDLLHIAEDFRGRGYGTLFLQGLDIEFVSLDARNIRATNLYTKLGYSLEFFEEEAEMEVA